VLDLPRSLLLALWGTAALQARVDTARAVRVVTGSDEPHTVEGEDLPFSASPTGPGLHDLLEQLDGKVAGLRAVLPVPGDALGLPGRPEVTQAAVQAGEGVVGVPREPSDPGWTYVPQVQAFGSEYEPGWQVVWCSWRNPVGARPLGGAFGDLSEAERALRGALLEATERLSTLDVARWREDAAADIAAVRDGGVDGRFIPPGTPPRAVRVIGTALRVRAIVKLAHGDDGAALNVWEASRRAEVLRHVDGIARRALVAVTSVEDRPG